MNKESKVVVLLPAMRMGGAEKIALGFLKRLSEHYDVTLALNKLEGELLQSVPANVQIVEDRLWSFREILLYDLKHCKFFYLLKDLQYYVRVKLQKNIERNYRYLVSRSPWTLGHYDIAIGYVANVSTQIFSLADRSNADRKLAWIHGETNELMDTDLFGTIYRNFDAVYCVSQISRTHFLSKYPSCNNTRVYYNPIDREAILAGAWMETELPFEKEYFNILSVGRLSPEKGFDMVPAILQKLLGRGRQVKWFIIGDGTERERIKADAKRLGVQDSLVMLGTLSNPYPYMKACDLYVQPSYEEGYSTTICEAGILGCAIVGTTSSGGIYEQVEDGISAVLAKPDPESLATVIDELLRDATKRERIRAEVLKLDFCHEESVENL